MEKVLNRNIIFTLSVELLSNEFTFITSIYNEDIPYFRNVPPLLFSRLYICYALVMTLKDGYMSLPLLGFLAIKSGCRSWDKIEILHIIVLSVATLLFYI